jgi:DNA mismatch endonuclease (patch repair protein)
MRPPHGVNAQTKQTMFGSLTRSELMSRIRSSGNRTTELKLVALLRSYKLPGWRRGYPLRGNPDFVWPTNGLVVFVDGCFWHGHDCRNLTPRDNAAYWQRRIAINTKRDRAVTRLLRQQGWAVLRFWECTLQSDPTCVIRRIQRALFQSTLPR